MGYIEQMDVGNIYITDVNDWFATLSNLNRECKNYTDSEIRYKDILAEHDKQITTQLLAPYDVESIEELVTNSYNKGKQDARAEVIDEVLNLKHYAFKNDDDNMYIRIRDVEQLKEI